MKNAHQNILCFNGGLSFIGCMFWNMSMTNIWTTLMQCDLGLHHPFLFKCMQRWNSSTRDVYNVFCLAVCHLFQDTCCLWIKQQQCFFCLFWNFFLICNDFIWIFGWNFSNSNVYSEIWIKMSFCVFQYKFLVCRYSFTWSKT